MQTVSFYDYRLSVIPGDLAQFSVDFRMEFFRFLR